MTQPDTFQVVCDLICIAGLAIAAVLMACAAAIMRYDRLGKPEPAWVRFVCRVARIR